jgi:leader peptidase (prepilin peptidase)/N-methyltransferase
MEIGALLVATSAGLVFSEWLLWVSCGLGWTLLALAAIDYRHMILPDELTLPLIPAGLALAYFVDPSEVASHIFGAGVGFVAFCILAWVYRQLRGREGLGMGDAKLLAASGSWVAISGLASVVFLGSVLALLAVLGASALGWRVSAYDPLPFGMYLCLGTWLVWLFGPLVLPGG